MHQRTMLRAALVGGTILMTAASGCGTTQDIDKKQNPEAPDAGTPGPNYGTDGGGASGDAGTEPGSTAMPHEFAVTLVPEAVTGVQRVNFAVPVAPGVLSDAAAIKILAAGTELPAARRALAKYADGSLRSVQLQVDVNVTSVQSLTVQLGVAGQAGPALVDVATTLAGSGNNIHPKVWVRLPAELMAASGVAGPVVPQAQIANTALDVWGAHCDYDAWDTDAFLVNASASRDVWLFDRVTAMYRGYASTGALVPLRSGYREAEIYRAGMTISNGVTTAIAVPTASSDLKYHYSQGMALHYLLTGDDRFREAAEAVSARVVGMWNPTYSGGFWTERHAGFALLAHEWAAIVSDDKAATIAARAETAVTAYLAQQMQQPSGYTDQDARCFAHSGGAHGESWSYMGCSPWMSAILADGLDAHARRVGGARATAVRQSLARLGRIIARDGRDSTGRPLYWMGVGNSSDETDGYDEHWGEAAYVVAMAWDASGRTEANLKQAADALITGFRQKGAIGHVRSFNWQCRSAVMAPYFLK